jgi:hypothetical protein
MPKYRINKTTHQPQKKGSQVYREEESKEESNLINLKG